MRLSRSSPGAPIDPPSPAQQLAAARPRASFCAVLLVAVFACGSTEGPLLRAKDGGTGLHSQPEQSNAGPSQDAGAGAASLPTAPLTPITPVIPVSPVTAGMRLHYQISGSPQIDATADLFVLDLFDTEADQLSTLHTRDKVVIAYMSAGSHEPWRPDADDFPAAVRGARLAGYPNESWLDIRDDAVRELMKARLKLARDKGFDGVFPGSLDAYRNDSGFSISESDQLDYDGFLSSEALALGLTPGLSGEFALSPHLVEQFDWAIAFGCLAAGSCERLRPWLDMHRAVFNLELEGELDAVCEQSAALGIVTVMKRPSFDAWSRACP